MEKSRQMYLKFTKSECFFKKVSWKDTFQKNKDTLKKVFLKIACSTNNTNNCFNTEGIKHLNKVTSWYQWSLQSQIQAWLPGFI